MIMQGRILRTIMRDVRFCGSGEEGATSCEGKTQEGLQSCRYFLWPQREAQWEDVCRCPSRRGRNVAGPRHWP